MPLSASDPRRRLRPGLHHPWIIQLLADKYALGNWVTLEFEPLRRIVAVRISLIPGAVFRIANSGRSRTQGE